MRSTLRSVADLIATGVGMSFTARPLFEDVALSVEPGDRIALVGPNGAGKTTLLRILAGQLMPSRGEIHKPDHIRLALHDQRPERSTLPLLEFSAPAHLVELESRLRELEVEMASGDAAVMVEYDKVRTRYDMAGGDGWPSRVEAVLRGLGFVDRQFTQTLDSLSGGELTRASLARALAADPDILLLDEPTNHLDMQAIDWLDQHLEERKGAVLLVSHDRWFVESTCTSVLEVVGGKARRFNGSFVEYRAQQALEAATHGRQLERWQGEMARLQRFVDRFSAGTRSRQAQSRVKAMDKLRDAAPQYADLRNRRTMDFKLPVTVQPGRLVYDVRGITLGFPDRPLLVPTDFVIERGEKVALLGRNGMGKSTLLHSLAAETDPHMKPPAGFQSGDIRVGYNVAPRLLSQHDAELKDNLSLLGNMNVASPKISRKDAMSLLGLFGFRGEDAEQRTGELSGGERRRLLMAMALTGANNVLLLDEPTNHLDIESREALEAALVEFPGTVLLISHDRALIDGVATRTIVLHDHTVTTVLGGYTEAKAILDGTPTAKPKATSLPAQSKAPARKITKKSPPKSSLGSGNTRTVKRGKPKHRRPATIEQDIEKYESIAASAQERMLDPEVYTSKELSAKALDEHADAERRIARLWDELESSTAFFE